MSGTVPPPPPPPDPGAGSDDTSASPQVPLAAYNPPPSFAARAGGGHAPIPPAPRSGQQPGASASSGPAATQAWQPPVQPTAHQPSVQSPPSPARGYPAPARYPAHPPAAPTSALPPQQPPAPHQQVPGAYAYVPQEHAYQQAPQPASTTQNPAVAGRRKRARLGPGWIAFIVADSLLVVLALVLGIQTLGGSGGADVVADGGTDDGIVVAEPDGDEADDDEDEDEGDDPGERLARFASPTRNIICEIYENQTLCKIAELNQQPAPVDGCDGTVGYVATLSAAGEVSRPCVPPADQPTAAGGGMDVLDYGQSVTEGDFTCRSEENGMFCQHDPSGRGFSLARAGVGTY